MSKMNAFFCQGFDNVPERMPLVFTSSSIPATLRMHSQLLRIGFLLNQHGLKIVPL